MKRISLIAFNIIAFMLCSIICNAQSKETKIQQEPTADAVQLQVIAMDPPVVSGESKRPITETDRVPAAHQEAIKKAESEAYRMPVVIIPEPATLNVDAKSKKDK